MAKEKRKPGTVIGKNCYKTIYVATCDTQTLTNDGTKIQAVFYGYAVDEFAIYARQTVDILRLLTQATPSFA